MALETAIATANADLGSLGYLTTPGLRGKLKTTDKTSGYGQFLWTDGEPGAGLLNGYKALTSTQVPSNLTKGTGTNLHPIIFGNWSDMLINHWGAADLLVDPYTGSAAGTTRVRILQEVDIIIRNVASFAAIVDAIAV